MWNCCLPLLNAGLLSFFYFNDYFCLKGKVFIFAIVSIVPCELFHLNHKKRWEKETKRLERVKLQMVLME